MIGSLFAGVSGLSANATAMSVIGDNIANVNTTAFKSNSSTFANILSQSLGGSSGNEIGRGVQFWGTSSLWTQGTLETTGNPTDLAISGKGFFMVTDDSGTVYYTRAGVFDFDQDGNLVNPDGLKVQGYEVDSAGALGSLGDIAVSADSSPPKATDEVSITFNLDADADYLTAASTTVDCSPSARATVDCLNPNSDITYAAATGGTGGNNITITYVDGGVGTALDVSVIGDNITVSFDAAAPPTAAEVANFISTDSSAGAIAARALVTATAEGDGSGQVGVVPGVTLAGGGDIDSDITYTALSSGIGGNSVSISYVVSGLNTPLSVGVVGNDITVYVATDGYGSATSTAADIANFINTDAGAGAVAARALVAPVASGTGLGYVEAISQTNLSGGLDSAVYSTAMTTYDSLGGAVTVTFDFTKRDLTTWDWVASVPASVGTCTSSGAIEFGSDGELDPSGSGGINPTINVTGLVSGADDMVVEWAYLEGSQSNGTITGYASPSSTTFQSQNGYPSGTLQSISVDEEGFVSALYSNGQITPLYQICLADFPSYSGLSKMGENLFAESLLSGQPSPGVAGSGGLGSISPGALEMSNVDLAKEFVKMITTQRAFQANSRVITTSDEILSELISLKR